MRHSLNPLGPDDQSAPTPTKRHPKRTWLVIMVVAGVTMLGVGGTALVLMSDSFQHLFGEYSATTLPLATRFADLPSGNAVRLGRGRVSQVAYAPDSQTLAVASSIGVWLYRLNPPDHGRLLPTTAWVKSVEWSPDGHRLVGGASGKVFVWSVSDGRTLQTIALPEDMALSSRVQWSPDGAFIAANVLLVGRSETRIWSAATGQLVHLFSSTHAHDSLSWSPDSRQLAVAVENEVQIWMVATEHIVSTLHGRASSIYLVAWSPDGSKIATGSGDPVLALNETVHVWAASDGRLSTTIHTRAGEVTDLAWSPDGTQLITSGRDAVAQVWSANDGHSIFTIVGHLHAIDSVSWSPDGQQIATGSGFDSDLRIWSARDGRLLSIFGEHVHWIESVRWSPDGNVVAAGAQDGRVWIWSARDGQLIRTFASNHPESFIRTSIAWSPDGHYLAVQGNPSSTIQVWSVADGRLVRTLTSKIASISSISYAPNGQYIAAGLVDGTICIWRVADGRLVQTLTSNARETISIHWSPDGTQIAGGMSEGQVVIWNIAEARIVQTLEARQMVDVHSVRWSPDGTMIAVGSTDTQQGFKTTYAGTMRVWMIADSQLVSLVQAEGRELSMGDSAVNSISWSPNNKMAASDYGGEVRLSTVDNGQIVSLLNGHTATIKDVDWSPDGARIASGSSDGTIVLWNIQRGTTK
jgi:WD40 repeat protein